jgi:hypothetical protein
MARTASRRLPRDVIANIYLHARLRCGVGRLEQLCRRRPIEILLAKVLADARGTPRTTTMALRRSSVTVAFPGWISPCRQMTHIMASSAS